MTFEYLRFSSYVHANLIGFVNLKAQTFQHAVFTNGTVTRAVFSPVGYLQVGYRAAPAIEPSYQHDVVLWASRRYQQLLAQLTLRPLPIRPTLDFRQGYRRRQILTPIAPD